MIYGSGIGALACILTFLLGGLVGSTSQVSSFENLYGIQKKIAECETILPRNQTCEIIILAKPKEGLSE